MREYANKPENESRTVDSNPQASMQTPMSEILQTYKAPSVWDATVQQKAENRTGLPDGLKAGMEAKSGFSMDDVRVNFNSPKPAQLQALAYTQGSEIHVAPGQEKYLAHEAWHVVQQKQGRVQPTAQLKGVNVNDNEALEREADVMGAEVSRGAGSVQMKKQSSNNRLSGAAPVQMANGMEAGYFSRNGKRKSRRVINMEEFGDRNRIHNVSPDKYRDRLNEEKDLSDNMIDEKTGIWRPSKAEGTARPEDPPIYQPVRDAYHRAHHLYTSFSTQSNALQQEPLAGYWEVLTNSGELIKSFSLEYKSHIRNFNDEGSIDLQKEYKNNLERIRAVLLRLAWKMLDNYKRTNGLDELDEQTLGDMKAAEGEEMWRGKWWAAIQKVNSILGEEWGQHKIAIKNWVKERLATEKLEYMQEDMIGDLDYIGSLAKGYKSAPKQYMHFLPEKFDVDANLDAPPLAVYAISHGSSIDRGAVKSEHLSPLKDFEDAVRNKLKTVPGIDQLDPFEVFVRADNVTDIMGGNNEVVRDAQQKEALSERFQEIENSIWWLKMKHPKEVSGMIKKFETLLKPGGSRLKEHSLKAEDDGHHKYTEVELTKIEYDIKQLEQECELLDAEAAKSGQCPEADVRLDEVKKSQDEVKDRHKEIADAMAVSVREISNPDVADEAMTNQDKLERLEHHASLYYAT